MSLPTAAGTEDGATISDAVSARNRDLSMPTQLKAGTAGAHPLYLWLA